MRRWEYTPAARAVAFVVSLSLLNPQGVLAQINMTSTTFNGGTVSDPLLIPSGSATVPGMGFSADADGTGTGIFRSAANQPSITINGAESYRITATTFSMLNNGAIIRAGSAGDLRLRRLSAGVWTQGGSADANIGALLGGGAAVASATALPAPTGNVFHVTGTTVITSITSTNFVTGACFTMIFDGITTLTDGSNLVLAGNFVTTADDTISLCFDGTSFYETARSVN